jgi:hypothetical protein
MRKLLFFGSVYAAVAELPDNVSSTTSNMLEHYISQCHEMGQVAGEACNVTRFQYEVQEELLAPADPYVIDYLPIDDEPNFLVPSAAKV